MAMPGGPFYAWCPSSEAFTELQRAAKKEATDRGEEARLYWVVSSSTLFALRVSPRAGRHVAARYVSLL